VRAAVEKELGARGYEKANGAAADVEVHYHVNVSQDVEPGALHRSTADCQAMECEPRVYDEGTLFVDLVDTRTGTLLWRGWAQGPADGVVQNQALLETEIDRAVAQILQRLR
jgi:hypothetical protein